MNDDAKRRQRQIAGIAAGPAKTTEDEAATYGRDRHWFNTYVTPFYMQWMGYGGASADAQALVPELRARAAELNREDIELMLSMHWRLQVMGAWYAVLANDPTLSQPVLAAIDSCRGSLTAAGLCAAASSTQTTTPFKCCVPTVSAETSLPDTARSPKLQQPSPTSADRKTGTKWILVAWRG